MSRIITAVRKGDLEAVKQLVVEGLDPDEPDSNGRPPLLEAVVRRNVSMVNLLLRSGCSVVATNPQGDTALHLAVLSTPICPEIIYALLDAGADPNIPEKLTGNTVLHALVKHDGGRGVEGRRDTLKVLERLVKHGDVSALNMSRSTPLHKAVYATDDDDVVSERVAILLEAGAVADVQDELRDTPLHLAVDRRLSRTAEKLVKGGANINRVDRYLQTALHCAASKNCVDIMKVLLREPSCDVNAADLNGETPLHLAAGKGHARVTRLLVSHPDVDVARTNGRGMVPLHIAIESGFVEVVEELLGANCDLLSRSGYDQTPLELACSDYVWKTRPEISQLLFRAMQETVDSCGLGETPI